MNKKNIIEILVNGKVVRTVKTTEKQTDLLLGDILAQMDECPHGSNWENSKPCEDCKG